SPGPASGREPELIRATVGHRQVEPDGPVAEVEADLRAIAGPAVRERRGAVATQGRLDLVAALLGRHGGALGVTRHAETRPLDGPWTTRRYSSLLGKHCAQHASPKTRHCSGLTSLTFWARSTLVHEAPLAYWRCTTPKRLITISLMTTNLGRAAGAAVDPGRRRTRVRRSDRPTRPGQTAATGRRPRSLMAGRSGTVRTVRRPSAMCRAG